MGIPHFKAKTILRRNFTQFGPDLYIESLKSFHLFSFLDFFKVKELTQHFP